MGRGDNRLTKKVRQRRSQAKKKAREKQWKNDKKAQS